MHRCSTFNKGGSLSDTIHYSCSNAQRKSMGNSESAGIVWGSRVSPCQAAGDSFTTLHTRHHHAFRSTGMANFSHYYSPRYAKLLTA